jgi:hypothetical protein
MSKVIYTDTTSLHIGLHVLGTTYIASSRTSKKRQYYAKNDVVKESSMAFVSRTYEELTIFFGSF